MCGLYLMLFPFFFHLSLRKVWQKRYCVVKDGQFTLAHSPVSNEQNCIVQSIVLLFVTMYLNNEAYMCVLSFTSMGT